MTLEEIKSVFSDGAEITDSEIRWLIAEVERLQQKTDTPTGWETTLHKICKATAQRCAEIADKCESHGCSCSWDICKEFGL